MFYRYLGHSGNDSPIAVMTWKLKSLQSYRFLTVGKKRKQKPSKFNNSDEVYVQKQSMLSFYVIFI